MRFSYISALIVLIGCQLEEAPSRGIGGHTLSFAGVWHGTSAANAQRLCQKCHGESLDGGDRGEPACLTCHGEVWKERDPNLSLAPADHTAIEGGYTHHPNRAQPIGTCNNSVCHGVELEGKGLNEPPGCLLCHVKNWN